MLRRIPLGKMNNLRDLGGYPLSGGGETAWERILRGDNPVGLTDKDIKWLLDRKITTIIDMRSGFEQEHHPDELRNQPGFTYCPCTLVGGEVLPHTEADVSARYYDVLEGKESVRAVLSLIAVAPDGVLLHCTAGKDRTGLISALLLGLVGVERADLLADYQVSDTYLGEIILLDKVAKQFGVELPELAAFLGRSKREYLDDCLTKLTRKYGSIPNYLQAIGLTAAELDRLRIKMTETN